jgi:hypothetical protein
MYIDVLSNPDMTMTGASSACGYLDSIPNSDSSRFAKGKTASTTSYLVFETKTSRCSQELLAKLCQQLSKETTETARIDALSDALDVHHNVLPEPCSLRQGCLDPLEDAIIETS